MAFFDTPNQYRRTLIEIHAFDDGTQELRTNETELIDPPCSGGGAGCRAMDYEQEHCEFDPKTGLCGGRMA